ncbi:MAG: acyl-CoA dehydrogenase [Actinobacteria bacterium]|nr:acyl-CoA dehydrogenase [Actinomycetota bacterium]
MNIEVSEEQIAFRKSVRDFAEQEIAPFSAEWDRSEQMDRSIVKKLASVGLLGGTLPECYGGMGMDNMSYCLMIEELGRADSSVRGVVSVNVGLVGKTILRWGTESQKEQWLPSLCSGDGIGCYGLTEPDAGSDAAALRTRAERVGGDWRLNGSKMFITNGTWASFALIFARTGSEEISAFLVPTESPGFSARPIMGKLGLRAADTAELTLSDVLVADENRLGEVGEGLRVAMSALDNGRMSLSAGCVGLGQACLEASLSYAGERRAFGKPIAGFQLIQELIAEMAMDIDASRLLTWRVAALADEGKPHKLESSFAKLFASEAAVKASNNALQIYGGYGYIDEYPVGRLMRDARVTTLYEGTSQMQKLIIGRALTGQSAFS